MQLKCSKQFDFVWRNLAGEPGLEPRLTESECSLLFCFYCVSFGYVTSMLRINIPEMFISTSNGE